MPWLFNANRCGQSFEWKSLVWAFDGVSKNLCEKVCPSIRLKISCRENTVTHGTKTKKKSPPFPQFFLSHRVLPSIRTPFLCIIIRARPHNSVMSVIHQITYSTHTNILQEKYDCGCATQGRTRSCWRLSMAIEWDAFPRAWLTADPIVPLPRIACKRLAKTDYKSINHIILLSHIPLLVDNNTLQLTLEHLKHSFLKPSELELELEYEKQLSRSIFSDETNAHPINNSEVKEKSLASILLLPLETKPPTHTHGRKKKYWFFHPNFYRKLTNNHESLGWFHRWWWWLSERGRPRRLHWSRRCSRWGQFSLTQPLQLGGWSFGTLNLTNIFFFCLFKPPCWTFNSAFSIVSESLRILYHSWRFTLCNIWFIATIYNV